jgi:hypothetical protein
MDENAKGSRAVWLKSVHGRRKSCSMISVREKKDIGI